MDRPVTRRRVFYIPGYDPIHPRRYRELYRKESAAQGAISGYEVCLSPKDARGGPYGWHLDSTIDGQAVSADVEVLVWSDIVRDSMGRSIPATYLQMARTAAVYIGTGVLWRLMRLRKGPVIAALYPVGMLLLQLVLAVLIGLAVFTYGFRLLDAGIQATRGPHMLGPYFEARIGLMAALGTLAAIGVLRWFKKQDGKFFAYYLMHDYSFSARYLGANPPALEARMAAFGDAIADALADQCDEVLVVGHSSGAHLAVSVLSDLIRAGRVPEGAVLAFLSLGQVVPMVSFLPRAGRLRADLAFLSARDDITWVDITAPSDGCAFALCDPVAVTGVAPANKRWPLVVSAAFSRTLAPDTWKALRWRFFRLHFQYLCAFDRPGDYDYFQITAGPRSLAARYRDRPASKSRIETPVSKYRGMT